ncbi:MAG: phage minor head protein [Elusimicrobiota bacterium]|jgi:SPP1 gp7 family putative phage head morphogenesis protein
MQELLRRVLKVWEKRLTLTPAQLQAFGEDAYSRGWGLAGIWETKFLERIQASITKAQAAGSTYSDWTQNEAQKILDGFGAGVRIYHGRGPGGDRWDPAYAELVMRNATQASFAGGRYSAEWAPEWQQIAPFWRYYATLDDRTRPTHAALHGKVFRKDDAAARSFLPPLGHNCFPAETPILGSIRRGFSYRYSGDVVRIQTRAGNRLTLTIDHPVLTPRGWVAAKLLREGDDVLSHVGGAEGGLDPLRTDEVVRGILGPRETRLAAPRLNVHGRPAFAGELFGALPEASRERMADGRTKDLYGDPRVEERHVEVEREHGELLLHAKAATAELVRYLRLALVHVDHSLVASLRRADEHVEWALGAAYGSPRLGALALDGGGVGLQLGPLDPLRIAPATKRHAQLAELASEGVSRAPGFVCELLHRLAGLVSSGDGGKPGDHPAGRGALAEDTLTSVRYGSFNGDVFDFETAHGWMVAGSIAISNCRCQAQELTLAEIEDAGFNITPGAQVPFLPTADGGTIGRPPGGWDVDRVLSSMSRTLRDATLARETPVTHPNSAAPAPQTI